MFLLLIGMVIWLTHAFFLFLGTNPFPSSKKINQLNDQLTQRKFENLPIRNIASSGSAYEIVSYKNGVIYYSNSTVNHYFTAKELSFIPEFDDRYYRTWVKFKDKNGQPLSIVQKNHVYDKYQDEPFDLVKEEFDFLLDDRLRVISSQRPMTHTQFTERELKLMTHTFSKNYNLHRHDFTTKDGEKMAFILYRPYDTEGDYRQTARLMFLNFLILIASAVGMIFIFAHRIRKKISYPLDLLEVALMQLSKQDKNNDIYVTYDGPKEFLKICATFNDIATELHQSEVERKKLEVSKQKMLADISHDLKTPITVIQGYIKAMEEHIIDEKDQDRYLQIIYHKTNVLNDLINDFHEFSKIQHPDFAMNLEQTDFTEYLRNFWSRCYEEFAANQYPLEIDIPEESLYVELDSFKFNRVLNNIIGNFFRHNPKGTTFYFKVLVRDGRIEIMLADDGVAIDPETAQSIFQPFVTGDKARTTGKNGTGLGLAIVQQFVQLHNGTVRLDTACPAPYSKAFIITLPLLKPVQENV